MKISHKVSKYSKRVQENVSAFERFLRILDIARPSSDITTLMQAFTTTIQQGVVHDPFSLEIHPHLPQMPRCVNACSPCTGKTYDHSPEFDAGITPKILNKLVNDIIQVPNRKNNRHTPFVLFAGNCTEPLLYPDLHTYIDKLLNAGVVVGMLTNLILGNPMCFHTFAGSECSTSRYLRASINAADSVDYDRFHNPNKEYISEVLEAMKIPLGVGETVFDRVIRNVEILVQMRKDRGSNKCCSIGIGYLLYEGNDNQRAIPDFLQWADGIGVDYVEFRFPQIPQMCDFEFKSLSQNRAEDMTAFLSGQKETLNRTKLIVPTDIPRKITRPKPFAKCWTRFACAVIGFDGGLYPCTSVAAPQLNRFAEGNLNSHDDFWELWRAPQRLKRFADFYVKDMCDAPVPGTTNPTHVCTRTEFAINELLDMCCVSLDDLEHRI